MFPTMIKRDGQRETEEEITECFLYYSKMK